MSFADFDRGVPSKEIQNRKNEWAQQQQAAKEREILTLWHESERRLNILRSFSAHTDQGPTNKEMQRWLAAINKRTH